MITPTIGRKVWFRPNGTTRVDSERQLAIIDYTAPLDATVTYVWNDRMVNLLIVDHYGYTHKATSVTLRQEGDALPHGLYAEWMPYQQGQAKTAGVIKMNPAELNIAAGASA